MCPPRGLFSVRWSLFQGASLCVHTGVPESRTAGRCPGQRSWCEPHALPQVQLTVSPLPALSDEDQLLCHFGDSPAHPARVEGDAVICNSPRTIPNTPPGQGEAPVQLLGGHLPSQGCRLRWREHLPGWIEMEAHKRFWFWNP